MKFLKHFLVWLLVLSTVSLTAHAGQFFVGPGIVIPTGTSGGIPYYSSTTTVASSAVLSANGIVVGGGAGVAPLTQPCTVDTNGSIACTSASSTLPNFSIKNTTADAGSANVIFTKEHGAATPVQSGDVLGTFLSQGYANGADRNASFFQFTVTGTPSGSNIPSAVVFHAEDAAGDVAGTLDFKWDQNAHLSFAPPGVPTITACGGSPSAARGSDNAGEVTEGTTATGCVISFKTAYAAAPFCTVTSQSQLVSFAYTISTSAITVVNTSASGDKIDWVCFGA